MFERSQRRRKEPEGDTAADRHLDVLAWGPGSRQEIRDLGAADLQMVTEVR